jgi:hypothetical protein
MKTNARAGAAAVLAIASLCHPSVTTAEPADYVSTPIVEEGEREIDFKAGSARLRDDARENMSSLGLGWGATRHWFTELYAVWHKPPGAAQGFDAWEWENRFQLTETGQYPVDVGFLFELERPQDRSEGIDYRWGPLLQADLGTHVQANLNLLFEKSIRTRLPASAELGYQWQLKYRWRPELEFGLQGFGDVGPWSDWEPASEQPHRAGPALFGRFGVGERQFIRWNAGWLLGATHGAPRDTVRVQAEYEF